MKNCTKENIQLKMLASKTSEGTRKPYTSASKWRKFVGLASVARTLRKTSPQSVTTVAGNFLKQILALVFPGFNHGKIIRCSSDTENPPLKFLKANLEIRGEIAKGRICIQKKRSYD